MVTLLVAVSHTVTAQSAQFSRFRGPSICFHTHSAIFSAVGCSRMSLRYAWSSFESTLSRTADETSQKSMIMSSSFTLPAISTASLYVCP